ncbi:MAG: efflux transporter outer membrane subunit [Burkholderiaceae bacterium]|nr:efflux transporter outer membrane subunit [Burkholderiaceae bacterium]
MKPGRISKLLAAVLAATLGGCALTPNYQRPEAPVAAAYPGASAAAGPLAADIDWQTFFSDARLRRVIDLALRNNRDLRIALLNIEQARAQYDIRRSDQLPTLGVSAAASRTPTTSGGIASSYSVALGLTAWEIDFFGRIASLKDAALAQYLATEESRKATQISLIGAVASVWLSLLADEEQIDITRQTLASREESVKLVRLRFDNGVTSELDLRQAESLVEAARVALSQWLRQRALDQNLLTLLAGQPLPPEWLTVSPAGALAGAGVMADVPAGLPSDLLAKRPDIRAAEQQLIAANANIGAARAAFFPRISLTAGVGTVSNQLSGLFASGSYGWTFAPQLLLPLFDAGRNQAGLESARAGRELAVAQYDKSIQSAFREVADALAGRTTLSEQLRAQQAQADAEAARLRLTDLRYRSGVASHLDLLDAQRALFTARQAVIQVRLQQLQNQVTLYKALGGGWKE